MRQLPEQSASSQTAPRRGGAEVTFRESAEDGIRCQGCAGETIDTNGRGAL